MKVSSSRFGHHIVCLELWSGLAKTMRSRSDLLRRPAGLDDASAQLESSTHVTAEEACLHFPSDPDNHQTYGEEHSARHHAPISDAG
jgi:hypothetical protein